MSATEQSELLAFAYRFDENTRKTLVRSLGTDACRAIKGEDCF